MKVIGIDIGTTSICGVCVDADSGAIIRSVTLDNNSFIKTENPYEKIQDSAVIMAAVGSILGELNAAQADAIGFSGQMHGILYTDTNGEAVSPLYIWQDERANLKAESGKTYAEEFGAFAGYGLATDYFNRLNGLVPESAAYLCTIADYAVMKLCSLSKPLMHITNAASLGRFNVSSNSFEVENPLLPSVTADFKKAGEWNGVPVCVALGDNQASFIGSVRDDGNALINVGTGAQISWLSESSQASGNVEARPFDGKRYLMAGCSLCGGRAFALLEKLFREAVTAATGDDCKSFYPVLNKILETKTETDLKADCRFCGERKNPFVRGSVSNLSENNFTVGDFALAILEGMAEELHSMYLTGGQKASGIVCSGNGMRKNVSLQRITSSLFESEVKIPYYCEEAAYGAALSAFPLCGVCESVSQACKKIRYQGE